MSRQLLRRRSPLPTYHGASEGKKSRGSEGGCTSAGAVTAGVRPLLLLLLLRRDVRSALCRCRRPTASNGTAPAKLSAALPKCEPAPRGIYTALRIPPPRPLPARSERCWEGRASPSWPRPRRAPPPAAPARPPLAQHGAPGREAFGERREVVGLGQRHGQVGEESPDTLIWGWSRAECFHSPDPGRP